METRAKLRPTVTITTYSASNSSFNKHKKQQSNEGAEDNLKQQDQTKSEYSTELFNRFRQQLRSSSTTTTTTTTAINSVLANNVLINNEANILAANKSKFHIDLSQIKGPTGSIRGHRDVVRKSLEGIRIAYNRRPISSINTSFKSNNNNNNNSNSTMVDPVNNSNKNHHNSRDASINYSIVTSESMLTDPKVQRLSSFLSSTSSASSLSSANNHGKNEAYFNEYLENLLDEEQDHCVAYITSLGVIRRSYEDSKVVKYEERDIFLNQEYKLQLKVRLNSITVPAIFVDGKHIGGLKELEAMNESGDLSKRLAKFKMASPLKGVCLCCGNARFIACQSCNGSRKSTIHHFKFNSIALRCIKCDKNDGLIQCPVCSSSNGQLMPTLSSISSKVNMSETGLDQNNNSNNDDDLATVPNKNLTVKLLSDAC